MRAISAPLVGAYFRPGATLILTYLRAGTVLHLCPEPQNPIDSNAIAVYLPLGSFPTDAEEVEETLAGFGVSLDILASDPFHLGYISAPFASIWTEARERDRSWKEEPHISSPWEGKLLFSPEGKYLVGVTSLGGRPL